MICHKENVFMDIGARRAPKKIFLGVGRRGFYFCFIKSDKGRIYFYFLIITGEHFWGIFSQKGILDLFIKCHKGKI
jgi:hypothetical protein